MVQMGVRAGIARDQRPFGTSYSEVVSVDAKGNERDRRWVRHPPGVKLRVVHFVDLDDGERVTTEGFGEMVLSVRRDSTLAELRAELREFIFEDDMVEPDEEPRWEDMLSVLRERGVAADDEALARLPFVVELDDEVRATER
jgi:hypothetical protein